MRVGSIGYATCQGLGVLLRSFYDHGIVTDVFILEHSRHPTQWEWYPETTPRCSTRQMDGRAMRKFCSEMDVMLFFETPFDWSLVEYCRQRGVKTVLVPMYECSLQRPPAQFDEYWCPSLLDLRYFCNSPERVTDTSSVEPFSTCFRHDGGGLSWFTTVPVEVEWKQRHTAKVFVHNSGHGGLKGRNGTRELVEGLRHVKTSPTVIIRSQSPIDETILGEVGLARDLSAERDTEGRRKYEFKVNNVSVLLQIGTWSQKELYSDGDVFIFPEKFNGLSLPLQEARAAGMLVICGDRFPMNQWLPTEPLIPVERTVKNRIGPPYMEFDEAVIDPRVIAEKIDEFYGQDIHEYSQDGLAWAKRMSWDVLGPKYKALLEELK